MPFWAGVGVEGALDDFVIFCASLRKGDIDRDMVLDTLGDRLFVERVLSGGGVERNPCIADELVSPDVLDPASLGLKS